mgnify:CR=1 FL=1
MKTQTSVLALSVSLAGFAAPVLADQDPWALLSSVSTQEVIDGDHYEVRKSFPEAMMAGISDFAITGFAVPIGAGAQVSQVMLVSDMGNCPLCGSPDHGASLVVELDQPIPSFEQGARLSLRGDLEAVTDPETWQNAVLRRARVVAN